MNPLKKLLRSLLLSLKSAIWKKQKREDLKMTREKPRSIGALQKLEHRADALIPPQYAAVDTHQLIDGEYIALPTVGRSFILYKGYGPVFMSSNVVSVYVVDNEDRDKLVLPKDFPNPLDVVFPAELRAGDILFATLNSIYYLKPDFKGVIDGAEKI